MENKNPFIYQYSAQRNKEVEEIRKKYMPREVDKLETLKKLDLRVQSAGLVEGLSIGIFGSFVFGIAMCFGLGVFTGPSWIAVLFGFLGIGIMIPAYPITKYIAKKTKKELTPEILKLSEEIMNA